MQRHDSIASSKVELLLARSELKWLLIHLRTYEQKQVVVEDGKQFAKCRKGFFNYFEFLGKLLKSGKAWESFLSFVYQERFQKQQESFCKSLSKSGKAFKNSGKGFFPKFPKITLGKERERKAFSPSGYFANKFEGFPTSVFS